MSDRSQWKMLHLLYTIPPSAQKGLSTAELLEAGIDCYSDTMQPLIRSGVITVEQDRYALSDAAAAMLETFIVANRRWSGKDILIDYPKAFVIMPFHEPWSEKVYDQLIKPAIEGASLACVRGDTSLRIGDLSQNIWNEILEAGIIVADVSAINANVFYEIGLAHAVGKEVFILKQKDLKIPADFGGAHYYEYDLNDLSAAKDKLQADLSALALENHFQAVKALLKR